MQLTERWDRVVYRAGLLVLVYAVCLHALWGAIMTASANALKTTPLDYILFFFGQRPGGIILFASAALATYGLLTPGLKGLIISLPQNALLWIAAFGGIAAAVSGHYADGVPRPHNFIFVDQLPMILVAPFHAVSLALHHGKTWAPRQTHSTRFR